MKTQDLMLLGAIAVVGYIAVTVFSKPAAAAPGAAPALPPGVGPSNVQIPNNMPGMTVNQDMGGTDFGVAGSGW